jgi:hypothetical protein
LGALRKVNTVVRPDSNTALCMDGQVEVRSTFGYDQFPDSYFTIVNTGLSGDTWTIYIAGTSVDPSLPDRDIPAYSKIFTVEASEVGDEISFRNRIVTELNADATFKSTCYLKAVKCTDRATIQIHSTKFSASNEFYERPTAGSFTVTITGTAQVIVGFDNLISRSKPVTISKDIDSPHRLGTFGVSGTVSITYKELADLFVQEAQYLGSPNMLVNGSITPIVFTIPASQTSDIYIEDLIYDGQGNGVRFGNFLASSALINGVLLTIKSDNVITSFPLIYRNEDFKNKFAALSGDGSNFRIDVQAGSDEILAILRFNNPFVMRAQNTFGTGNDDYIKITIQDNLTAKGSRFNFRAKGFEKEP